MSRVKKSAVLVFSVSLGVGIAASLIASARKLGNGRLRPDAKPGSMIRVRENVQVSLANADRYHAEVWLASDPENPDHLLACSMIRPPQPSAQVWNTVVYTSLDGGKTWQLSLEDKEAAEEDEAVLTSVDPSCAFGPGGTAYFVTEVVRRSTAGGSRMLIFNSSDSGKTWTRRAVLPVADRPFLTVDTTNGKYHRRLYITGTGIITSTDLEGRQATSESLMVYRSADGAITFQPPFVMGVERDWLPSWGAGVVLSDGTYVAPYEEVSSALQKTQDLEKILRPTIPNSRLKVLSSTDGGETFSHPVNVSDVPRSESAILVSVPCLAVDRMGGPFHDRLYVAWNEYFQGGSNILLSYSSDKGKSWSKPVTVNDEGQRSGWAAAGIPHSLPAVAVNRDGIVGVMWYDRRENPDGLGYWVRFAVSLDGGDTFMPSVKVSEAPASYDGAHLFISSTVYGGGDRWYKSSKGSPAGQLIHVKLGPEVWPGHTAGLAVSSDGAFHPLWVDNRTGVMQIWTARVSVAGKAVRNGLTDLAGFEDISDKLTLDLANPTLDREKGTLTVDVYLANTSSEVIVGPVKMRVLSLRSPLGNYNMTIANSNSTDRAAAGLLDFSMVLDRGKLRPGERSKAKRLDFRFRDVPPLHADWITDNAWAFRGRDRVGFVNFDAKILGHIEK